MGGVSPELFVLLMFVGIAVGVFMGFPIAFALAGLGLIFGYIGWGNSVFQLMGSRAYSVMTNMTYVAIPLFVFMGCMLEKSGVADVAFGALNQWLRKVKGGLGIATIIIAVIFAASVGVVGASVTTMGLLALAPMIDRGYDKSLATGIVAAGGTLGILIPPSIMIVVFGPIAGVSVVKLFAGAIAPGLTLGLVYGLYVGLIGHIKKGMVPDIVKDDTGPLQFTLIQGLVAFVPLITLILSVLGAIFFGIAAPTEAAGVGALGAMAIAAGYRKLNMKSMSGAALDTLRTSTMVMFVIMGANIFTAVFFGVGGTRIVSGFFAQLGLSAYGTLFVVLGIVFVLGVFIDWVGIVLIVVPLFMPILTEYGFDPLYTSMIIIVMLQTSFLTPPFAYALFYIKGIAPPSVTLVDIYKGAVPFICLQLIVIVICLVFPSFLTYLPGLLVG